MLDLEVIRGQLDEIDNEIVTLFEKRMQLCKDVAKFKIETGKQNVTLKTLAKIADALGVKESVLIEDFKGKP